MMQMTSYVLTVAPVVSLSKHRGVRKESAVTICCYQHVIEMNEQYHVGHAESTAIRASAHSTLCCMLFVKTLKLVLQAYITYAQRSKHRVTTCKNPH
jgi:hypothetical protein